MARRKSLEKLLLDLRAKCGLSLEPQANEGVRDSHVLRLQHIQENLWQEFNWPHLKVYRHIPIQAGQRYYDPPEDIDIDRITSIQVRAQGAWAPIPAGIGPDLRTAYDPDFANPLLSPFVTGERDWPPRRWAISENDQEQIELWPIPSVDASPNEGILRIEGIRNLKPLVDQDDLCDLDAELITLWAAYEILNRDGSKDAPYTLNRAKQRQRRLQGNLTPRKRFRMFDGGVSDVATYNPGHLAVSTYVKPRN